MHSYVNRAWVSFIKSSQVSLRPCMLNLAHTQNVCELLPQDMYYCISPKERCQPKTWNFRLTTAPVSGAFKPDKRRPRFFRISVIVLHANRIEHYDTDAAQRDNDSKDKTGNTFSFRHACHLTEIIAAFREIYKPLFQYFPPEFFMNFQDIFQLCSILLAVFQPIAFRRIVTFAMNGKLFHKKTESLRHRTAGCSCKNAGQPTIEIR